RQRCQARGQRQCRALRRPRPDDGTEVTERTSDMKYTGNKQATRTFLVRALSFSAAAALTLNPALAPVMAADANDNVKATPVAAVAPAKTRFLALGIGK